MVTRETEGNYRGKEPATAEGRYGTKVTPEDIAREMEERRREDEEQGIPSMKALHMDAFDVAWGVLKAQSNMQTTLPAEYYGQGEFNQTQRSSTIHPAIASMIARYKNEAEQNQEPNPFAALLGGPQEEPRADYTAENVLGDKDPTLNPSLGPADSENPGGRISGQRFDETQIGRIRPDYKGDEVGVITHRASMPAIGQEQKPDAYGQMQQENMWTTPQGTETNTPLGPRGTVNQFIDPQMQSEIGPQMRLPQDTSSVQTRTW